MMRDEYISEEDNLCETLCLSAFVAHRLPGKKPSKKRNFPSMNSLAATEEKTRAIQRLTALWALSESGLGGIMFALKIPFTGFFLGAFAVIIISMIAYISERDYKQIVQSTILVIMVKAMVSPHSPPPAYLAVAFQGFAGTLLFRMKNFRAACMLLGIFAMLESALQKIIVLTFIFGNDLWSAVNNFFADLKISFGLHGISFSWLLIGLYALLYAGWGAFVGVWASRMPRSVEDHKMQLEVLPVLNNNHADPGPVKKRGKWKQWLQYLLMIAFIALVFYFNGGSNKILRIVLRSISTILLLYFVLRPLVKYLLQRWLQHQQGKKNEANELILLLPQMKGYVSAAYSLAKQQSSVFSRMKEFIIYLIGMALYGK